MGWKPIAKDCIPTIGDVVLVCNVQRSPLEVISCPPGFYTGKVYDTRSLLSRSDCCIDQISYLGKEEGGSPNSIVRCPDVIIWPFAQTPIWAYKTPSTRSYAWVAAVWRPGENYNNILYFKNITAIDGNGIGPLQPK